MDQHLPLFQKLAIALALGLLIGLERSWSETHWERRERIAGIRTFGLIALLGALSGLLAPASPLLLPVALAGLALLLTAMAALEAHHIRDFGITTPVAALIAFLLGVWVALDREVVAAAVAVTTALLLSLKHPLHRWVASLTDEELYAILRLLLISVVLLPILPRRPVDPFGAINPFELWGMVVLIAAISFVGYFAVKIAGARRGLVATGLLGGLTSSTAVTLSFARLARRAPELTPLLAAGIVAACSTMFPRILLLAQLFSPPLAERLLLPLLAAALIGYGSVFWLLRSRGKVPEGKTELPLKNPFEFSEALRFGLFLALVSFLAKVVEKRFGSAGLFAVAAASGITDVDAITLSVARMSGSEISHQTAAWAVVIAASVNTLVKGMMALVLGGRPLARLLLPLFGLQLLVAIGLLK